MIVQNTIIHYFSFVLRLTCTYYPFSVKLYEVCVGDRLALKEPWVWLITRMSTQTGSGFSQEFKLISSIFTLYINRHEPYKLQENVDGT